MDEVGEDIKGVGCGQVLTPVKQVGFLTNHNFCSFEFFPFKQWSVTFRLAIT
jgi:hypothetical protein